MADSEAAEMRSKLERALVLGPAATRTMDELVQDMLNHMRARQRPEGTIRQYKSNWNVWVPADVGGARCADVGLSQFESVLNHLAAEGASPGTIRPVVRTMRAAVKFGQARGYFGEFPFGPVAAQNELVNELVDCSPKSVRSGRISHEECPGPDDMEKLAAAFEEVYPGYGRRLVFVAYGSGLRIMELAALTADDVDLERQMFSVNRQLDRHRPWPATRLPKGRKTRQASFWGGIGQHVESLVADALARPPQDPEHGRLFPRHHSTTGWASKLGTLADEAVARCGWQWSFHWTRHSYASTCIAPLSAGGFGLDPASVQAWLGHGKLTTTLDLYVSRRSDDWRLAIERTQQLPAAKAPPPPGNR